MIFPTFFLQVILVMHAIVRVYVDPEYLLGASSCISRVNSDGVITWSR